MNDVHLGVTLTWQTCQAMSSIVNQMGKAVAVRCALSALSLCLGRAPQDIFSFGAAISACEKSSCWEIAVTLLRASTVQVRIETLDETFFNICTLYTSCNDMCSTHAFQLIRC